MKYLKKFNNHSDYVSFIEAKNFEIPTVSFCGQEVDVHFMSSYDFSQDYLTFVALEDGTFSFSGNAIQYSLDNGNTWQTLASNTQSPTVTAGNNIMWKQTGLTPTSSNGIGRFSSTNKFEVKGNIMSLYYGDEYYGKTDLSGKNYSFYRLFNGNTKVISAENLVLPATTLAERCYANMFYGCTSLTTAPELPAITLANYCYDWMFINCTSLTTAPELPATTLANYCYNWMFYGCTNLNYIKCLATDISANNCLAKWVYGVSANGTFTRANSSVNWPSGASGIPNGWTTVDAS